MERYFFYLLYLLLGCSLCGCSRKQAPKQTQDPDTETTIPYADTIAAPVPPAPAKSRTARYLDSLGFVNIAEADSSIAIDLMYTRADNFTGTLLYEDLKEAYLHPDAMKSLKRAQRLLKEQYPGYSLIVYDAARPLSVQQKMWDVVKGTSKYIYVSNPSRGGGLHNYGLAVDISILDDKGTPLPMGTPVDHLGREAHITEEAVLVAQGKLTEQERENRLLLRQDNADLRLTALSHARGLADARRMALVEKKRDGAVSLLEKLRTRKLPASPERDGWLAAHGQPITSATLFADELLRRPEIDMEALATLCPELADFAPDAAEQAELSVKYDGYLKKQQAQVARARAMEDWLIPEDIDYETIESLRIEARQKLAHKLPQSLSQAGRIPGVNPADVAVLMVWLKKRREERT